MLPYARNSSTFSGLFALSTSFNIPLYVTGSFSVNSLRLPYARLMQLLNRAVTLEIDVKFRSFPPTNISSPPPYFISRILSPPRTLLLHFFPFDQSDPEAIFCCCASAFIVLTNFSQIGALWFPGRVPSVDEGHFEGFLRRHAEASSDSPATGVVRLHGKRIFLPTRRNENSTLRLGPSQVCMENYPSLKEFVAPTEPLYSDPVVAPVLF